jgi:hypothetical protein
VGDAMGGVGSDMQFLPKIFRGLLLDATTSKGLVREEGFVQLL